MKKHLFLLLLCPYLAYGADFQKGFTCYKKENFQCALNEWAPLADQGYVLAQSNLGLMYASGRGVKQDYIEAAKWLRKAADQGSAMAQSDLGLMYEIGQGVKQDYVEAMKLYRKAADQGDALAQSNLGLMYVKGRGIKKDFVEAEKWYRKAADQGNAQAHSNLGYMYEIGQGVKQDYGEAIKLYRKAADQGYALAQSNLGLMYAGGRGVKQDYIEAAKWLRKAAVQGNAIAQFYLGVSYANGQGVKQDYVEATKWYRKAADQGSALAQGNLAYMFEFGNGVKQNTERALALYKKSGTDWSMIRHAALKQKMSCLSTTGTKLFEANLICAKRDELMAAVKKAGAFVKHEDKQTWGDTYYTDKILRGTSELYIGYTVDDEFAMAQYTFPGSMDTGLVTKVRDIVVGKYGQPGFSSGDAGLGNVTHRWNLKDGIELKVSRGWPNTTTYLTYTYPENYSKMTAEQERQRKAKESKEYQKQSNAF